MDDVCKCLFYVGRANITKPYTWQTRAKMILSLDQEFTADYNGPQKCKYKKAMIGNNLFISKNSPAICLFVLQTQEDLRDNIC